MELAAKRFADAVIVTPAGRVDQSNAEAFHSALAPHLQQCAADQDRVILDLSGLDYISSAGLRILMLAAKQCKAQKGILVLTGLQPLVREIFEISKFTMVFTITPSLREAVAKASPGALTAFEKAA